MLGGKESSGVDNTDKTEENDKSVEVESRLVKTESRLVYNHVSKTLDMSRMRATDFKYDKRLMLPGPEQADKESLHQIRRNEMLKLFCNVASTGCPRKQFTLFQNALIF